MTDITICYLGGGSKNWAQKYFSDLLLQDKVSGTIKLYDIDEKAARLNERYFKKMVKENKKTIRSSWSCFVVNDINTALKDSDFVLISILPHELERMKVDVHYPEHYGIIQSVGDTVGPGGYSRALRTLDSFNYFGLKIKENCPDAWVINYTNPMSMCTNALYEAFPEIKALGCCHEVFSSQSLIAGVNDLFQGLSESGKKAFMDGDLKGVESELKKNGKKFSQYKHPKTDRHEIKVNIQGINHFTFIDKAEKNDVDITPIYSAFTTLLKEKRKPKNQTVKFDIYTRFGVFGAAGDRHLAEFLPSLYLPLWKKNYSDESFGLTSVFNRLLRDRLRRIQLHLLAYLPIKIRMKKSGEEGSLIIAALAGEGDIITNVNLPNIGQAPNLPMGTAVETNAKITKDKIEPINSGNIKNEELLKVVTTHSENQRDYVKAFNNKDKEKLRHIFMRDPSVERLGDAMASKLFDEMIKENSSVLPDWLK